MTATATLDEDVIADLSSRIATCSYKQFRPEMGVPIQTSVARPRWRLAYPLTERLPMLTPFGIFGKAGMDAIENYEPAYLARLDDTGAPMIGLALREIASRHPGDRLVLLCFESYVDGHPEKPGDFCHRRMFADWFEAHTGLMIPELGGT